MNHQKGLAPVLIVILITLALGGYLVYQKQNQPKTVINPQGYTGPPPEKILHLTSNDECKENINLCNLISQIRENMKKANYFLLLNLHEKVEKECITGSLPASVCKGAKEGEKRNGYLIGPQDTEFDIASKDKYITRIGEFVKSNTPLNYEGTVIATNRASVSYTNQSAQKFLIFNLYQGENGWRIKDVVLGINHKGYLKSFYPTLE